MELLEKYSYTVYQTGSFSAAAKELFISQPALSTAIARHEKNLGFAIFDRSVIPIALTPEGRIYVEYLDEKEKSENYMLNRIKMLRDASYGAVSIGVYSYSASEMLAKICSVFNEKYPNVNVRLDMGSIGRIGNLSEKMRSHSLDMMLGYDFDPSECVGIPILNETMLIAMHKDMEGASKIAHLAVPRERIISGVLTKEDYVSDLSVFRDIKFFEYSYFSNTRYKMNQILGSYKIVNYVVENARQVGMHNNLMKERIGAIMTTDYHIRMSKFDDDNILYFLPKSDFLQRTLYIIMQKDITLSAAAEKFLEVAREVSGIK